jgi:hypothetical protein
MNSTYINKTELAEYIQVLKDSIGLLTHVGQERLESLGLKLGDLFLNPHSPDEGFIISLDIVGKPKIELFYFSGIIKNTIKLEGTKYPLAWTDTTTLNNNWTYQTLEEVLDKLSNHKTNNSI